MALIHAVRANLVFARTEPRRIVVAGRCAAVMRGGDARRCAAAMRGGDARRCAAMRGGDARRHSGDAR
jgi:hypothetical protein